MIQDDYVHERSLISFCKLLSAVILDHDAFWTTVSISSISLKIISVITLCHLGPE